MGDKEGAATEEKEKKGELKPDTQELGLQDSPKTCQPPRGRDLLEALIKASHPRPLIYSPLRQTPYEYLWGTLRTERNLK